MNIAWKNISLYSKSMLAVCAVLVLIIVAEVYLLGTDSNAAGQAAMEPIVVPDNSATSLQIPPVVAYREVVERPLFSDSRRPAQQATKSAESVRAVQLAAKWKVTGIVVAGEYSFVHVEGIRDHKTVRLRAGMPLDGWKLEQIEPDHIEFSAAGESVTLKLYEDKDKTTPRRP